MTTKDIYGNARTSSKNTTEILIMADYVDNLAFVSPIGVSDLTNWESIYG